MFLDKRKGPTLPVRPGGGAIGQGEGPYTCLFAGMYSIMARSHRWELWGKRLRVLHDRVLHEVLGNDTS